MGSRKLASLLQSKERAASNVSLLVSRKTLPDNLFAIRQDLDANISTAAFEIMENKFDGRFVNRPISRLISNFYLTHSSNAFSHVYGSNLEKV